MRRMVWAPVVLAALLLCATAGAAPVTVDLRVEGAASTIFEGPVTTGGEPVDMGGGPHLCDGTNGGKNPVPGATAFGALAAAAKATPFALQGTWDDGFQDFFLSSIGPDANDFGAGRFWGYARNFVEIQVGGCQQQVQQGDQVLFGFDFSAGPPNYEAKPMLELLGPTRAAVGESVIVTVRNGTTHEPVPGAGIAGVPGVTGADGRLTFVAGAPGVRRLKAEAPGTIRSNGVDVCVEAPGSGSCSGFTSPLAGPLSVVHDSSAPEARITGPRHGRTYRHGPRLLRGTASDDRSGVRQVKLALRRHVRGRGCTWWSGRRERFVGRNCHKKFFFAIGDDPRWSYLLPRALGPGHYVLDVKAVDGAGNRAEAFRRGRNRTVFDVRRTRSGAARAAAAARVEVMVAGRKGLIAKPRSVRAAATKLRVSGRTCAVPGSTPLAALAGVLEHVQVGFALRDYGSCRRDSAGSSGQLFVTRIGRERNSGQDGWVYKVDDRAPSRGAADGRLRGGDRLVWMYCEQDLETGGCQRSLRVLPSARSGRAGESLALHVFGYDDKRTRRAAPGARVRLTAGRKEITAAVSGADGSALLTLPGAGRYELAATAAGLVPSFPVTIRTR